MNFQELYCTKLANFFIWQILFSTKNLFCLFVLQKYLFFAFCIHKTQIFFAYKSRVATRSFSVRTQHGVAFSIIRSNKLDYFENATTPCNKCTIKTQVAKKLCSFFLSTLHLSTFLGFLHVIQHPSRAP